MLLGQWLHQWLVWAALARALLCSSSPILFIYFLDSVGIEWARVQSLLEPLATLSGLSP